MCMCVHFNYVYVYIYVVSSPYLFVFGDDRVTRYTRANDVTSGAGEA